MHRRRRGRPALFGVVLGATVLAMSGVVLAGLQPRAKTAISRVARSNRGATHLARAIFEGNGRRFVRAKFVTIPPGHNPVAISTKPIAGFPRRGGAFAILTTGCAGVVDRPNKRGNTGCRDGGLRIRGAKDVTIWRIRLRVPHGANCLSFRFKFLSEEYPEWVGTEFNDAFVAELDHAPSWSSTGNRHPVVQAPKSFATTRDGNLITVNGTQNARVTRRAAKGTTYDAATGKLRASVPVRPGSHLLYLSIFDQGDRQWDSAVFVDRLSVRRAKRCRSGVVRSK